ncbi:MAG: cysteine hydrolase family protein [Pseudomonadota bacterium]
MTNVLNERSTALIIIDMQRCMTDLNTARCNNPGAAAHICSLLDAWRQARQPIVHVRHISRSPNSVFAPGQAGAEFDPRVAPLAGEHVVEKNVTDAFIHSTLERWLRIRGIESIVIVGVSTNYSVEATARTAGNLGFDTTVVADACFTFDMADLKGAIRPAEEMHLISLSNLQGEYATVTDTAAVIAAMDQRWSSQVDD